VEEALNAHDGENAVGVVRTNETVTVQFGAITPND